MKIIKPSVEYFGAIPTEYNAALKFIEIAGRTCYKSEDKITEDSAEEFVRKLIKAGHLAMIEHSNFVVRTRRIDSLLTSLQGSIGKYLIAVATPDYTYIGGSLTAWYQRLLLENTYKGPFNCFFHIWGNLFGLDKIVFSHGFRDIPKTEWWQPCLYDEIPKELHRYSAKFICDRGVSHELVRHRPCSFAQESTRYVNYGGKDMEFIEPTDLENWQDDSYRQFMLACADAEDAYHYMVKPEGPLSPQQARAVLPNALKTEIVVTADAAEWAHIRKLRTAKAAHPDMQRVMNMMPWEEFLDKQTEENKIHRCKKHHKDFTGNICLECEEEESNIPTAYHEG